MFPASYSWGIAIKKAAYTVSKLAVSLLTLGQAKPMIGDRLTQDQTMAIQGAVGFIVAASLEWLHDFLKLKYPNIKWL